MRTKPYDLISIPEFMLRLVLLLLAALLSLSSVAQRLEVHHINVGQGDATLFISKDAGGTVKKTVLIDGGRYKKHGTLILDYLQTLNINTLDFVIATHFDADHTGGLVPILQKALADPLFTVSVVYDRGTIYPNDKSRAYKDLANQWGVNHITAVPGKTDTLYKDATYNMTMRCLAVNGTILLSNGTSTNVVPATMAHPDENDLSTAYVFNFGKFRYLTGGDIGGKSGQVAGSCDGSYGCNFLDIETQVIAVAGNISAYKVNHHGSRCSTNDTWAGSTSARVAVLSSGKHNTYKHPRQEVLNALEANATLQKVYMTSPENYYSRALGTKTVLNVANDTAIVLTVNNTNKDDKNEDKTINQKSIFFVGGTKYQEPDPVPPPVVSAALD